MRRVTQTVLLNNANRSVQELRKMDRSLESVDQTVNSDGQTKNDYLVVFSAHPGCPLSVYLTVAPEKAQPFGQKSKAKLSAIAFNRDVEIVGKKLDRYGRTIGKVMVADPTCNMPTCPKIHDAGLLQIKSGMAWCDRQDAREQAPKDRQDYELAEFQAKIHRLGLWGDTNPVPPWEWRHGGQ
jgi:endonuclease YncB( thermonuclease family)